MGHQHFDDHDAISHVVKKKAQGVVSLCESHGAETPGHLSAAADALRETSLIFLLVTLLFGQLGLSGSQGFPLLVTFALSLMVWKTGRSSWLGWARLERLHRVMMEEKYEIDHNRDQEREELTALYAAKGLEGKLLTDVIDVLMADNDRLLKVMLEEELGLSLASYEHPLKQACGAFLGSFFALSTGLLAFPLFGPLGVSLTMIISVLIGTTITSCYEKNEWIPAAVWNLSIAFLSAGIAYFVFEILQVGHM